MLKYLAKKETGFTLMELLIAVAIVVILAGVGIPVYLRFMASSKHAEASTNLSGIKLSEEGFKLASGVYLICAAAPRATPDQDAVPWADNPGGTFGQIDFSVGGDVRFVYAVQAVNAGGVNTFEAGALGDTDGDTTTILFTATQATSPAKVAVAGGTTITDAGFAAGGPDD